MKLELMKKHYINISLVFLILSVNSASYAQDDVLCPSINIIKFSSQKLDSAIKMNEAYLTYTSTYIYQSNELWWFAGVGDIKAGSLEQAILMGKNILNNMSVQIDINAKKIGNEYICNYGPGYIQARGKNLKDS